MIPGSKMNTKSSSTKSSLNNDNITVDAKHSDMVSHFKNLQNSIPLLKDELKKLVSEYNNKDNSRKNDIEYIIYRDNLREKINEIKERINKISNNDDLNNYLLDVGLLLHGYYENIENIKNVDSNIENFEDNLINYDEDEFDDEDITEEDDKLKKPEKNYKSVLNFFNTREDNDITDVTDTTLTTTTENNEIENKNDKLYTSMKISDFVKEETRFKKKSILEEYLQKIDPGYVTKIKVDVNICKCPICKIEMMLYPSDGIQICENCGIQQNILIESDKPSFKDPPLEVCYFSYKRINHYNESSINDKNILMNEFNLITLIFKNINKN